MFERVTFHLRNLRLCAMAVVYFMVLNMMLCTDSSAKENITSGNAKDLFFFQLKNPKRTLNNGFSYSVELHRPNQTPVLCRPDGQFYSGDGIRVRIKSNFAGHAYIVMAQGSSGKQKVLFPAGPNSAGENNIVSPDREYVIPEKGVIRFDENPGVERLLFILSRQELDLRKVLDSGNSLSVDSTTDPAALKNFGILVSRDSASPTTTAAVTYVVKSDPSKVVFVEVALNHLVRGCGAESTIASSTTVPSTSSVTTWTGPTTPSSTAAATSTAPATGTVSGTNRSPDVGTASNIADGVRPDRTELPATGAIYGIAPNTIRSSLPAANSAATAISTEQINRPVTDKWAVIVGLSKYKDSSMNLKAPQKDAESLASFLCNDAGFAESHVIRIYDKEATKENILATLDQLGKKVRPNDLFLFYANCHGSANTQTAGNFLLMYDYDGESSSMDRQLLMQDLSNLLKSRVHSERIILIVQACHSGFVKEGKALSAEAVSTDLQGIGRIIATACTGSESSWVYRRGGIFTMSLIPNLRKYPKLKEALMHTRDDVVADTRSDEESRQMHPVIKYDLWIGDDAVLMVKPSDPLP
jgi:hypothetical protein